MMVLRCRSVSLGSHRVRQLVMIKVFNFVTQNNENHGRFSMGLNNDRDEW